MPLAIVRQNITNMQVDAIVNPTNREMVGYSGIDFAVHEKAGEKLLAECRKKAPLLSGEAKITKGYALAAKHVIHVLSPVWQGGTEGEYAALKEVYGAALACAASHRCRTVAVPLIASGNNGYPKEKVLSLAMAAIGDFLLNHEMTVFLCVFDAKSYALSQKLFSEIRAWIDADDVEVHMAEEYPPQGAVLRSCTCDAMPAEAPCMAPVPHKEKSTKVSRSLEDYVKSTDKSFAQKLFELIDAKGMTDVACYKKANVDKKTFSKIKCKPASYRPSKQTAVAFAIALELSLEETQVLLSSAGLVLSESFVFDKIILYFIQKGNYNIFEINEALFAFDQVLLGSF